MDRIHGKKAVESQDERGRRDQGAAGACGILNGENQSFVKKDDVESFESVKRRSVESEGSEQCGGAVGQAGGWWTTAGIRWCALTGLKRERRQVEAGAGIPYAPTHLKRRSHRRRLDAGSGVVSGPPKTARDARSCSNAGAIMDARQDTGVVVTAMVTETQRPGLHLHDGSAGETLSEPHVTFSASPTLEILRVRIRSGVSKGRRQVQRQQVANAQTVGFLCAP